MEKSRYLHALCKQQIDFDCGWMKYRSLTSKTCDVTAYKNRNFTLTTRKRVNGKTRSYDDLNV